MKRHIPNFLTSMNLFSGCLALVAAFNGNLVAASILIGIAGIFDFFDGFSARILHVKSEIGKELDSLADVVSFGVVPAAIIFMMLKQNTSPIIGISIFGTDIIAYIAFVIPVFSALRLAKFNLDTRQTDSFIGVPTPANAILIASFPLILKQLGDNHFLSTILHNSYFLIAFTIIFSFLLVSELPLFAMKFKNIKWKENWYRFVFIFCSLILIILFQFIALPIIIFLYIAISLGIKVLSPAENKS